MSATALNVGDTRGEYDYEETSLGSSHILRDFNTFDQLHEIVNLAALPMPQRPDGIVTVAKYTSASSDNCRVTEAEYERVARKNPASIFLRCFAEFENSHILFGQAAVTELPTFDIFYGGTYVHKFC
jgi:hypothetical protein